MANIFKWRINGFSELLEPNDSSRYSQSFESGGYTWNLKLSLLKKGYIGLFVNLVNAHSLPIDTVVEVDFELCVYDQLQQKHLILRASPAYFRTTCSTLGYPDMVALDKFQCLNSGFLVNDNCCFHVNFLSIRKQQMDWKCFDCLSTHKALSTHRWKIENFSELQKPCALSNIFEAGGEKWNLKLYPDGYEKDNCLSIYLDFLTASTLRVGSKLYVDFTLCLLDQINGKHKKWRDIRYFDLKVPSLGWAQFLSLEVFSDASNGFLVENTCIIEVSVNVLQLVDPPTNCLSFLRLIGL